MSELESTKRAIDKKEVKILLEEGNIQGAYKRTLKEKSFVALEEMKKDGITIFKEGLEEEALTLEGAIEKEAKSKITEAFKKEEFYTALQILNRKNISVNILVKEFSEKEKREVLDKIPTEKLERLARDYKKDLTVIKEILDNRKRNKQHEISC